MTIFRFPLLITWFLFLGFLSHAQTDSAYLSEIQSYQDQLNNEFSDPKSSPLTKEDLKEFDSLDFFPVNQEYRVLAYLQRAEGEKAFDMPTTTGEKARYRKYGELHFIIDSLPLKLSVYQNLRLEKIPGYEDYLFLPFKDYTNGEQSYGGGRYIELKIPEGDTLILDFNKAYNPYCTYNPRYSCPIPPQENHLPIAIEAGVLKFEKE